jgi:hypothetical protein
MRFYNQPHQYYCGVDLHARSMYLCIRDQAGTIVFHHNLAAEANTFLKAIEPYKAGLVESNQRYLTPLIAPGWRPRSASFVCYVPHFFPGPTSRQNTTPRTVRSW